MIQILMCLFLSLGIHAEVDETHDVEYLNSHPKEKALILDAFKRSSDKKEGVIPVHVTSSSPVLIVRGIEKLDYYPELVRPLGLLIEKNYSTYFFTWNSRSSIHTTQKVLVASMEALLNKHPGKELTVIGHSAGGVVGTLAIQNLSEGLTHKVKFHSVSTPYFGYNAPKAAFVASPIFGVAPIQIGRGISKNISEMNLKGCKHWVTTNCELDSHACPYGKTLPQLGSKKEKLPCGNENIVELNDEGHSGALYRVVKEIISSK